MPGKVTRECRCSVSVPESGRLDAEAAEVDIALGAVVDFVVDEIEDACVDGAVVGVEEFVYFLEPAGGKLRPGIIDDLGNFIPISKERFFCSWFWRVGAVVSQAVETDPFASCGAFHAGACHIDHFQRQLRKGSHSPY